jgi:hypothetical protein
MTSVALAAGVAVAPVAAMTSVEDGWQIVPEQTLADLRGGIELPQNNLVAYFSIQRVIEVDGQVVASMQIVISHLDSGGPPSISISGANPALVQIMNALPVSAPTFSNADAAPAVAATSSQPTNGAVPATSSGSVSTTNTQTGSTAQFGSALASAVNAANGAVGGASGTGTPSGSTSGSSGATPVAATSSTPAAAASVNSGGSTTVTRIIPLATGGQIVISGLPNAAAITTAVQNEVRGATVQVATTINATLSSLSALNALSLGNAIRSQVIATAH